jgi:hypothetical protein
MSNEWELIKKALENPKFKWRTIEGVAEETSLDPITVVNTIGANQDTIIKSSITSIDGKDLFTTRKYYKSKSSPWQIITSSIINKVE